MQLGDELLELIKYGIWKNLRKRTNWNNKKKNKRVILCRELNK